jgi:hypothetical protein
MENRLRNLRLPALWPLACEAYHPENDRTLRSNAGAQTPRHTLSSEDGSQWENQLRGVTAV